MDHRPQQYQFHFRNVQLFKTASLGTGSYGAVCKAMCDLLPCAAKLLHPILFQNSGPGARSPRSRFEQECHFLNAMKHPNIVQYLGTTQDPDSGLPVLLMELMDESLTRFLERSHQPLSYHVEVTLCHDIALALDYLHSNDVIHRDLSSNNVLLIAGSRAKVTDFGMSKLLSINPRMTPYTTCPGTLVYMPPEAIRDPPVYSKKIDSFSFGVVEIQILTRQFPDPGPASEMVEDRRYRVGRIPVPIPDSDRRKSHIDLIDPAHLLLPMALRCLSYSEEDRPTAEVLCREIALLKEAPRYTQSVEQAQQRGEAAHDTERQLREENTQLSQHNHELQSQLEAMTQENTATLADSQREIQQLRQELHTKDSMLVTRQREIQQLRQELHTKEESVVARQRENQQLRQELHMKDGMLVTRQRENQQLRQELHTKEESLAARQRENQQLRQELQTEEETRQRENQQLRQELQTEEETRQREIQRLQHTVEYKERQLQANEQVTAEFQQNLIQREQTIHKLKQTIARLSQGPVERVKEKQHVPEAKQQLQQPKQLPQAITRTAKSEKHPKQEPKLSTPPHRMKRGAVSNKASKNKGLDIRTKTSC